MCCVKKRVQKMRNDGAKMCRKVEEPDSEPTPTIGSGEYGSARNPERVVRCGKEF